MNTKTDYLHFAIELITWILLGSFAFFMVISVFSNVNILGNYKSFLVQSGSMEPTIHTGDVIITKSQGQYSKNDIVTFMDTSNRKVTHRIIDVETQNEQSLFITKGDANRTQDSQRILAKNIVGKVIFTLPKLGYMVVFSKSLPGIILFIITPALLIIFDEIRKIKKNTQKVN